MNTQLFGAKYPSAHTVRPITRVSVSVVALCMLTSSIRAGTFFGLGDLPDGTFTSRAEGVSGDGSVVVGQGSSTSGFEAIRWTGETGMVGLGDLSGGSFSSAANGASGDGSVVVGGGNSTSGFEAFHWTSDTAMVGLSDLPAGTFNSRAFGISADGEVVAGQGNSAAGFEAFRWTSATGMVGLGDLTGGIFNSEARGISADGLAIVGASSSASGTEAFQWTSGGGMVGLGDVTGGNFYSFARATSADGSVVVGESESDSGVEAFHWTTDNGMVGLGDLAGGSYFSAANAVSGDGSVVVGRGSTASGDEAFIWDATNGLRNLRDELAATLGAALTGWTLTSAEAISADGRTVVGFGTNPAGNQEAWLAYLADEVYWFSDNSATWDSALSWTGPFVPGPADDVVIDPPGALTVTGPGAHTTVGSLSLGGSGTGRVTLQVAGTTSGDLSVASAADIDTNGELQLADGRVFSSQGLASYGLIRGSGTLDTNLSNRAGGQLRIASGESLIVSGADHTNEGNIEVIDGSLEFIGPLDNVVSTGLVTGEDATLRFGGGLVNSGALALSFGTSRVFGDLINGATGSVTVAGNSNATFYDDVTNNGTLNVAGGSTAVFFGALTGNGNVGLGDVQALGDLAPGASPGLMAFGGDLTLGPSANLQIEIGGLTPGSEFDQLSVADTVLLDGTLDVTLIDAFEPNVGDTFNVVTATTVAGTLDAQLPALTGGAGWIVDYQSDSVTLIVAAAGDGNGDGWVDGLDYLIWAANFGTHPGPDGESSDGDYNDDGWVDGLDYLLWAGSFGSHASVAVPEPSGLAIAMFGILSPTVLRRRY